MSEIVETVAQGLLDLWAGTKPRSFTKLYAYLGVGAAVAIVLLIVLH